MFRSVARLASALLAVPFLLFSSVWAPLHIHEPGAGHSYAFVHSHFEPHHLESHERDGSEFEQDTEPIVWLDNAILHQAAYHVHLGPPFIATSFEGLPAVTCWSATPFDDVAPVHGPPRRHLSFRGPPLSLA